MPDETTPTDDDSLDHESLDHHEFPWADPMPDSHAMWLNATRERFASRHPLTGWVLTGTAPDLTGLAPEEVLRLSAVTKSLVHGAVPDISGLPPEEAVPDISGLPPEEAMQLLVDAASVTDTGHEGARFFRALRTRTEPSVLGAALGHLLYRLGAGAFPEEAPEDPLRALTGIALDDAPDAVTLAAILGAGAATVAALRTAGDSNGSPPLLGSSRLGFSPFDGGSIHTGPPPTPAGQPPGTPTDALDTAYAELKYSKRRVPGGTGESNVRRPGAGTHRATKPARCDVL